MSGLTEFQIVVAQVFFQSKASTGYVVTGGAALLAFELITRPTADLDFFTHIPTESVAPARDAFLESAGKQGWQVSVKRDYPTFCRLLVTDRRREVIVDLAVDSPPVSASTMTILGPTLTPTELAGRKLLALFGRAEARDFADVYVLAQRFGQETLLAEAAEQDSGFSPFVLAEMITSLTRFTDEEIPVSKSVVPDLRAFFARWAEQLTDNDRR